MTCCTLCLPWVLLTSHLATLLIGLFGVWLSITNFGWTLPDEPTPTPPSGSTDTDSKAYEDYTYASRAYARASNDERFFIVVPCVVTVMVAALVILRGIFSRAFFNYTYSLYSSLGLWVLTMTWIVIYQTEVAWDSHLPLEAAGWIMFVQILLMLVLSAQVLLSMGVLRVQKAGWPTFNYRSLFTIEALFIVARMTLTVYTLIVLMSSQIIQGFSKPGTQRFTYLGIRFPLALSFSCMSVSCYNAVSTIESLLSMLFGRMNTCMNSVTTLLSALCNVVVAVIASPVIIKSVIPSTTHIYLETLYFSIGLCVVTFLHLVSCLAFPAISRATPQVILELPERLISVVSSVRTDHFQRPTFSLKMEKSLLIINLISSIFSLLSIIITTAVWNSPLYRAWGSALVLCANSATLVRTLPPVITELKFKQTENIPAIQKVISIGMESVALLVGGIAICARSYYGGEIFAGVINLLFVIFQVFVMVQLIKGIIVASKSGEGLHLSDTDEIPSQTEEEEEKEHQNNGEILA